MYGEKQAGRGHQECKYRGSSCTFTQSGQGGVHEKVTFEQMLERQGGRSCEDIWEVAISGRWTARATSLQQEHALHVPATEGQLV